MKADKEESNAKIVQFPSTISEKEAAEYRVEREILQAEIENFRHRVYDRYRLSWMLEHGHTLDEFVSGLMLCMIMHKPTTSKQLFEEWDAHIGFHHEIWLDENMFMRDIYTDPDKIAPFMTEDERDLWDADIVSRI